MKNPYEELVEQFRRADAKFGGSEGIGGFHLLVHRSGGEINHLFSSPCLIYLGTIFPHRKKAPNADGYSVFGTTEAKEAVEFFAELASLAGSSLPARIIRDEYLQYSNPLPAWLAYMYLHCQPTPVNDYHWPKEEKHPIVRAVLNWEWFRPFHNAAIAIEDGGLLVQPPQSATSSTAPTPSPRAVIPAFEIGSPNWIKNVDAANLEGVATETLGDYRGKRLAQYVAPDGMSGIDRDGRMWRRAGTTNSHPYYFKPSLRSQKLGDKTAE